MSTKPETKEPTYSRQCLSFETTVKTTLLRKRDVLEFPLQIPIPPDLKTRTESMLARFLSTGKVTAEDRSILQMLANRQVSRFESAMNTLTKASGGKYGLMAVERETLRNFLIHMLYQSIHHEISGGRLEDYAIIERDQQEALTEED